MEFDAKLTDVHQRSAKTLLQIQALQAQANQIAAMLKQGNDELLRLDGEERSLLALKAEQPKETPNA
jgi:hypothetical protein